MCIRDRPNTPFLREVGFANISYGILGILSIKYRSFWVPTIIAYAVFMWGAAIGHLYSIDVYKRQLFTRR